MKGVQCYELFGGIALKNHTFSFFFIINKALFHEDCTIYFCCQDKELWEFSLITLLKLSTSTLVDTIPEHGEINLNGSINRCDTAKPTA